MKSPNMITDSAPRLHRQDTKNRGPSPPPPDSVAPGKRKSRGTDPVQTSQAPACAAHECNGVHEVRHSDFQNPQSGKNPQNIVFVSVGEIKNNICCTAAAVVVAVVKRTDYKEFLCSLP